MNCVFDYQSPLFKAVENKNLDLVEFLVLNGADVNLRVPRNEGGTVLHEACLVRNNMLFVCLIVSIFVFFFVSVLVSLIFNNFGISLNSFED